MTKAVILSNGIVKQMTFEDILKQFDPMINKFAYVALEKIVFNKPEKEEMMQELRIQAWEAYRRYNGKFAFSTYLVPRLQLGVQKATTKLYAKKRTNKKGIVSLNKIIGGGESEQEFEGLLGEDDSEIASLEFRQFMNYLDKTLEPCERIMLKSLLDKDEFSIQNLADELGMTRQGANKKYNKFREKMAVVMKETGYVS